MTATRSRSARTARSCCTTTTSSTRWRTSTASASRSATSTPRAPARSAPSRRPRTCRPTPRPRSSSRAPATEMLARFSTVAGEQGSPDTWRDPRGFALKFYTTEGNYDLVGNNTPVFFIRDTMKFPHFIRSQKRRGGSGLRDNHMQWDFWSLNPESAAPGHLPHGRPRHPEDVPPHERLRQPHLPLGQRGRRASTGSSTTSTATRASRTSTGAEAERIAGQDADHHRRDLHDAIERRRLPELDAVDPGHALRGREDLPPQPVRPDEGVAARRLPAHRGRHDDAEPQPRQLLRADRAGGVRAVGGRAGHRLLARQDAARPRLRLQRHPPLPDRPELPPAAGQPARASTTSTPTSRTDRWPTTTTATARLRAEQRGSRLRRRRSARSRRAGRPTAPWCARPTRCARTTTTSSQAGLLVREVLGRRPARDVHRDGGRPPARRREVPGARARLRLLEERRRRDGQADRGARPAPASAAPTRAATPTTPRSSTTRSSRRRRTPPTDKRFAPPTREVCRVPPSGTRHPSSRGDRRRRFGSEVDPHHLSAASRRSRASSRMRRHRAARGRTA